MPGRARPRASARQFMLLAVNRPAQEPQVGAASSMKSVRSSGDTSPRCAMPASSARLLTSMARPWKQPASMGPPLTRMAGTSSLAMAIIMPGVILSQLLTRTMASRAWASIIASMESAMSSRLASG